MKDFERKRGEAFVAKVKKMSILFAVWLFAVSDPMVRKILFQTFKDMSAPLRIGKNVFPTGGIF